MSRTCRFGEDMQIERHGEVQVATSTLPMGVTKLFNWVPFLSGCQILRSINENLSKGVLAEVRGVLERSGNESSPLTKATRFNCIITINDFLAWYM